jgi:hypothetical protein
MTDCSVTKIDKKAMTTVLHGEHAFSDLFVAYLLTRNIRYEEDLVDQLFNSKRKTTGPDSAVARSLRQGRQARDSDSQIEPRDFSRDGWYDPLASKLFYEQVQKVGLHQLQR